MEEEGAPKTNEHVTEEIDLKTFKSIEEVLADYEVPPEQQATLETWIKNGDH